MGLFDTIARWTFNTLKTILKWVTILLVGYFTFSNVVGCAGSTISNLAAGNLNFSSSDCVFIGTILVFILIWVIIKCPYPDIIRKKGVNGEFVGKKDQCPNFYDDIIKPLIKYLFYTFISIVVLFVIMCGAKKAGYINNHFNNIPFFGDIFASCNINTEFDKGISTNIILILVLILLVYSISRVFLFITGTSPSEKTIEDRTVLPSFLGTLEEEIQGI